MLFRKNNVGRLAKLGYVFGMCERNSLNFGIYRVVRNRSQPVLIPLIR